MTSGGQRSQRFPSAGVCCGATPYDNRGEFRTHSLRRPRGAPRAAMSIKWNEANLQANEEEATAANRMQITEPKTPFHYLGDDGEPEAYPPKAAPATAAPREAKQAASQQLQPGMDLSKLASAALERREEQPEPEDEPEGATTRPILRALPTHWLTHHAHAQTKGASSTSTGRRTTRREAWRRCGRRQRRLWMRRRTTRTRTRTM